jgi:hypothetical protein
VQATKQRVAKIAQTKEKKRRIAQNIPSDDEGGPEVQGITGMNCLHTGYAF